MVAARPRQAMIILPILLFILGLILLALGAEGLVRGSSSLAASLGIRSLIIGLTLVAFATSAPELVVSITAALNNKSGLVIGNLLGSNIANISLVIGISALITPLKVGRDILKREIPLMIAISLIFVFFTLDLRISRGEGVILLLLFISYLYLNYSSAQKDSSSLNNLSEREELGAKRNTPLFSLFLIILGGAGLVNGAKLMVNSAVVFARAFGINELLIGFTLVALGTSLPELAASVVSAYRKETDLCLGNLIGSNIFNISLVLGSVALVSPFNLDKEVLSIYLPAFILTTLIILPLLRSGFVLSRVEGGGLMLGYLVYISWLFFR